MIKPQRKKEAYVRSVPKTGIIRHCLPSMVEDDLLDALRRAKSDDGSLQGHLFLSTACSFWP